MLFGFVVAGSSFSFSMWMLYLKLFEGQQVQGLTATLVAILGIGGIQLIFLGLLGEYIGRIYEEVKNRPNFVIKDKIKK